MTENKLLIITLASRHRFIKAYVFLMIDEERYYGSEARGREDAFSSGYGAPIHLFIT